MDFQAFKDSLADAEPPGGLAAPLRALWHQAKGNWDAAHDLAQAESSQAGAWVHAYLHRVEGDETNAQYWYGIAGRAPCSSSLNREWQEIATVLLEARFEPALELDH